MFKSFFPKPGMFFLSAFVWALIAVIFWQVGGLKLSAVLLHEKNAVVAKLSPLQSTKAQKQLISCLSAS